MSQNYMCKSVCSALCRQCWFVKCWGKFTMTEMTPALLSHLRSCANASYFQEQSQSHTRHQMSLKAQRQEETFEPYKNSPSLILSYPCAFTSKETELLYLSSEQRGWCLALLGLTGAYSFLLVPKEIMTASMRQVCTRQTNEHNPINPFLSRG